MSRRAPFVRLSREEKQQLEKICNARSSTQAAGFRARIVLLAGQVGNPGNQQIALELDCDPDTVCKWRRRFLEHRFDGLQDLPRSGAPGTFSPRRSS
jgi:transposase-like protein